MKYAVELTRTRLHANARTVPLVRRVVATVVAALVILVPAIVCAQSGDAPDPMATGMPGPSTSPVMSTVVLAGLALLPFLLVVSTSFAKIVVVLSLLRNALGAPTVPPNMVVTALGIALSAYVMAPVAIQIADAAAPLIEADREQLQDIAFLEEAGGEVIEPWRAFLAANSGNAELALFAELRNSEAPEDGADAPLSIALPAFAITELAEAFTIGFLLFLPFLVLDLLVGSVLLSLGMHMLSPTSVSLPFKLLLFVLVGGWMLLSESLVLGYVHPGGL